MAQVSMARSVFLLFFLAACTQAAPATPTSTPDLRTPLAMTAGAQTQLAMDAQSTADAEATASAVAATEAAGTAEALNGTATQQMALTETKATNVARNTETAATREASTQEAIIAATAQAQPMVDLLTQLQGDGLLANMGGEYLRLADFDKSWAQLGWFQWFPTFISADNFVVRTDIAYETASTTSDWWVTGCGFVFRLQDNDNYYFVFMNLDGYAQLARFKNDSYTSLQRGYYGKMDIPSGGVEMVLVVEDTWITVLINGKQVIRRSDGAFSGGELNYTLSSGTNKDFGTHCEMTDVDFWEIK